MSCITRTISSCQPLSLGLVLATTFWSLAIAGCQAQELAENIEVSGTAADATETFAIPSGLKTPADYFDFVEQMSAENEQAGLASQERQELENKMAHTVVAVVDKVLKLKNSPEEAMQAHYFRLQASQILLSNSAPGARKQLEQAIDSARKDKNPEVQAVGMKFFTEGMFRQWSELSKQDKESKLKEVAKFLSSGKPEPHKVNTVLTILQVLQQVQEEPLAKPLLEAVVPGFEKSDHPGIKAASKKFAGALRRLSLPGNSMELSGKLMDGTELDWESYRGKVVLVDFWATWCGPCRMEVPNVLRLYDKYHEQGFEVVGVSLDAELEQAESYISQYEIPWPNLFSPNEDERAWEAPMAVKYGVSGIPLAILLDREGKVVSLLARGPDLARLLKEQFPEAK